MFLIKIHFNDHNNLYLRNNVSEQTKICVNRKIRFSIKNIYF